MKLKFFIISLLFVSLHKPRQYTLTDISNALMVDASINHAASYASDGVIDEETAARRFIHTKSCPILPQTPSNTWIIAENAMNGISNQLFGVYSFVPMAMTWNVSLIVSGIYTRRSFELKPHKYVGWDLQLFEEFFDWEHFRKYWRKHAGIVMVRLKDYESCLEDGIWEAQGRLREVMRYPPFYAQKYAVLMEMLSRSNISFPVPPYTILRMDAKQSKLTAMFNYWKGGLATKMLLLEVHRSLRPASFIQQRVDAMMTKGDLVHSLSDSGITGVGRKYIAVHIRLEGDILLHMRRDFASSWKIALENIRTSKCFARLHRDRYARFVDAPPLYIASGLFNSTTAEDIHRLVYQNATNQQMHEEINIPIGRELNQLERAALVLRGLHALGFNEIHTSLSLQQSDNSHSDNTAAQNDRILSPEQEAWIDSLISRGSECFVTAHVPSSFSYMVKRMQLLDRGQVLKYVYITEKKFGKSHEFKQWGV